MSEKLVSIHTPTKKTVSPSHVHIDETLVNWGRPELALALKEQGLDAVFTRGAGALDLESDRATILQPTIEKIDGKFVVTVEPAQISLSAISAFRNTSKPISTDRKTLPELNHPRVRAAAKDKAVTNELAAQWSKKYAVLDTENPTATLDLLDSDAVVLKPRAGMRSQGVSIGSKDQIAQVISSEAFVTSTAWILEEKLDFSPAVPVRGRTPKDQELIDVANKRGAPKELRVYTFGRNPDGSLITSYVLRASLGEEAGLGNDEWVFLDPESIPQEVIDASSAIAANFESHTSVKEMHLGIDWVYAREFGKSDPRWINMEVNGSEPQLIYQSDNPEVSKEQVTLLAAQLGRIAEHN